MSTELNPPELAEKISAKGFTHAAGFRIVKIEPGYAEVALTRREDLVQFFGHFHGGSSRRWPTMPPVLPSPPVCRGAGLGSRSS